LAYKRWDIGPNTDPPELCPKYHLFRFNTDLREAIAVVSDENGGDYTLIQSSLEYGLKIKGLSLFRPLASTGDSIKG